MRLEQAIAIHHASARQSLVDTAAITIAESETWVIPALWLCDSLQVVTQAEMGAPCLPVLSLYFPQGIVVESEETKEVAEMQGLIDIYFAQAATTGNFVDTLHAVRDVLSPDFYSTKRPFDLCELGKRPLLQ